jgi:hypothetical protein
LLGSVLNSDGFGAVLLPVAAAGDVTAATAATDATSSCSIDATADAGVAVATLAAATAVAGEAASLGAVEGVSHPATGAAARLLLMPSVMTAIISLSAVAVSCAWISGARSFSI